MAQEITERLLAVMEKSLMVQLYSIGVPQGEIAKMLGKRINDVNVFLKPLTVREKKKKKEI